MNDTPTKPISGVKAMKDYFSVPGHPVTTAELSELTKAERRELAEGAASELGVTLKPVAGS